MFLRADSIKRAARKEAWYGDGTGLNPFRKTTRRANSWTHPSKPTGVNRDVEAAAEDETFALSNVQTEPIPESPKYGEHEIRRGSKPEELEMTTAAGAANGRSSEPDSGTTIGEKQSTRPASEEEKVRRRFVNKFWKRGSAEEGAERDDGEKKRPWYKGKDLKHEPFTVRNQLGATIFNSNINLLLIAAPVGIALHYAGIDGKVVFAVNFIAIIPLAGMLSFATEEISLHVGESLGGLLNASFGYVWSLMS